MQEIHKYCLTSQKNMGWILLLTWADSQLFHYSSNQKTSKKNPRHVSREIVLVRRRSTILLHAARKGFLKAGFYQYLLHPLPDALIGEFRLLVFIERQTYELVVFQRFGVREVLASVGHWPMSLAPTRSNSFLNTFIPSTKWSG
jgi:hypothetical protein